MGMAPAQGTGGDGGAPVTSLPTGGTISVSGYYDNIGASVLTTFTIDEISGLSVYVKRVASFEIQVAPPSGKRIQWSDGIMAVDEKLRLRLDGDVMHFVVDSSGNVQLTSEHGALAEETP